MKPKKAERPTSESPWRAETETAPKPQPPKPQMRTSILESKQKQKIPIKLVLKHEIILYMSQAN